jgi:hypothetical protein
MTIKLTIEQRLSLLANLPNQPGSISAGRLRNSLGEKLEFTDDELVRLGIQPQMPLSTSQKRRVTELEISSQEMQYLKDFLTPLVTGDKILPSLVPIYDNLTESAAAVIN